MNQWVASSSRKRTRSLDVDAGATADEVRSDPAQASKRPSMNTQNEKCQVKDYEVTQKAAEANCAAESGRKTGHAEEMEHEAEQEVRDGEGQCSTDNPVWQDNPFSILAERLDALTERHVTRGPFFRCLSDPFPDVEGEGECEGWESFQEGCGDSEGVLRGFIS